MTDELVSVAWVENQLTARTIKFFDKGDVPSNTMTAQVKAPPKQLSLSPPPNKRFEQQMSPLISKLRVVADPLRVKRGGTVSLTMGYQIGPAGIKSIEVSESRHPKRQTKTLSVGSHGSNYKQKIPVAGKPGRYTYRGEVCVENSCSSQSVEFTVVP
jgi:hypothetical protein